MRHHALVCAFAVTAAATLSCSSEEKSSSASNASNCGPGPYVKLTGHVNELTASGEGRPKEGVVVTFDVCPDKQFTSDADGNLIGNMTKGLKGAFKAEHQDIVSAYFGEWGTDADFDGTVQVIPKLFQGIIAPDFTPDKTLVGLGVTYPLGTFDAGVPDGGPTDPCQRSEGVTYSIPDHPEAKFVYLSADTIPKPDPNATATAKSGVASVSNLPDGIMITPVATKAGCTLTAKHNGFTGRMKVVKGYGSLLTFQLTK
jgi:hypothetical protein